MKQKKGKGLNETILGWFKRVHPEELWAVGKMPPKLTFEDVRKSMEAGDSMGVAAEHSDTMTREMILDRLAKLCGKGTDELVGWCNAKFREKTRVSGSLSGVDCLALADGLGRGGIDELRGILRLMKSQIEDCESTLREASSLL